MKKIKSKAVETELYDKIRSPELKNPNISMKDYYSDPELVVNALRNALNFHEIFGSRVYDVIVKDVTETKNFTDAEVNSMVKKSQSLSIWNSNEVIASRARSQRKEYIPIKFLR